MPYTLIAFLSVILLVILYVMYNCNIDDIPPITINDNYIIKNEDNKKIKHYIIRSSKPITVIVEDNCNIIIYNYSSIAHTIVQTCKKTDIFPNEKIII